MCEHVRFLLRQSHISLTILFNLFSYSYFKFYVHSKTHHYYITVYDKTSAAENVSSFCSFSLNCKSFPVNYGLVNQQYKSTLKTFTVNSHFHSKCESFLLWIFPVYSVWLVIICHLLNHLAWLSRHLGLSTDQFIFVSLYS